MTRRELREHCFKMLFSVDFYTTGEEAKAQIPRLKHYKNYRMSLHGFSHYHLIVADLSSGDLTCNRQGRSLKKLFNKIL